MKEIFKSYYKYIIPIVAILILVFYFLFFSKSQTQILKPKMGTVIEAIYGIATVTSRQVYDLRIGVSSNVAEIFHQEGDFINKGESLIRLTDFPTFKAPFSGVITYHPFSLGETVFPQAIILSLTDMKGLYLVVSLEQEGAIKVRKNQNVRFSFESLIGKKFSGKVSSIFSNQNQFLVHIESEELPQEILPGMSADVSIEIGKKENVLLIPIKAVHNGKISLRRNGKQIKVEIEIGNLDGEWGEITKGDVKLEDEILIHGRSKE
ncbi:MAG: HlyD family efflux transporter periplasmic adaptor subunit [Leptospiraceae bacterium]|nr:HlyD family efflux transporter periplasmic adaptor subunit [Leptospiraceae bacterium]